MDKDLSLLCKSKSDEKFLNFKVLKTIGKKRSFISVDAMPKLLQKEKKIISGKVYF